MESPTQGGGPFSILRQWYLEYSVSKVDAIGEESMEKTHLVLTTSEWLIIYTHIPMEA